MKELWTQIKNGLWSFFSGYGLTLVKALAIFVLGVLVIAVAVKAVKKASTKSRKIDNSATAFITSLVALVAYVILVLVLIGTLGFSTAGIVSAFSAVVLAIGLGMQNTLSSLTNGIVLIFTKPFQAGDFVDIGGTTGTVKEIKLFSVKLITTDNITVIVPNNTVLGSTIINYSRNPLRRLEIIVPVPYDADVEEVKAIVNAIVDKEERIVRDPAPFFRLTEYGASSLNFTLRTWTKSGDFWAVKFDLLENILQALRKAKIEIPYNQLDVHVIKTDREA